MGIALIYRIGGSILKKKYFGLVIIVLLVLITVSISLLVKQFGIKQIEDNELTLANSGELNEEINLKSMPLPESFTPFMTSEEYAKSSNYGLDDEGVLIYDYASNYNSAGIQYNPAWISQYAFTLYRDYVNSNYTDEELKRKFLIQANYLRDNRKDIGNFSVWEYDFDNNTFGANAPWRSAMANGRIISVMIQAHSITNDKNYLDIAERAYQAFLVDTKNYGVATFLENGSVVCQH